MCLSTLNIQVTRRSLYLHRFELSRQRQEEETRGTRCGTFLAVYPGLGFHHRFEGSCQLDRCNLYRFSVSQVWQNVLTAAYLCEVNVCLIAQRRFLVFGAYAATPPSLAWVGSNFIEP